MPLQHWLKGLSYGLLLLLINLRKGVVGWVNTRTIFPRPHLSLVAASSLQLSNQEADEDTTLAALEEQLLKQIPQPLKSTPPSNHLLAGERQKAKKRPSSGGRSSSPSLIPHNNKTSDHRIRLFCFYGVADSSTSMRTWTQSTTTTVPSWIDVRIVELPGHGYLAKDQEFLPCASRRESSLQPVSNKELNKQFSKWISWVADDMEPLIQDSTPFSMYGFSFGALLAYHVCLELERRGHPPPLVFVASGRGAPHAAIHSDKLQQDLQTWQDDQVLGFLSSIGFDTTSIPEKRRARAAKLYRCGMILSGLYVGKVKSSVNVTGNLWDQHHSNNDTTATTFSSVPHADGYPLLNCPVVSVTGSLDTIWPPSLVERWSDMTLKEYHHVCFEGISHEKLMNAQETKQFVFKKIAQIMVDTQT